MAKKSREQLLAFYSTAEGVRKINTVRSGILNKAITNFPEVFATIAPSNLQILLGKEYYAFSKNIEDPGRFTLNEISIMADFFSVDFTIMFDFVRKTMIDEQKKAKRRKK